MKIFDMRIFGMMHGFIRIYMDLSQFFEAK